MATASRILGDEVSSAAPAFLAFLAVHVLAGLGSEGRENATHGVDVFRAEREHG